MASYDNSRFGIDDNTGLKDKDALYSHRSLHQEENAEDMLQSHDAVEEYWRARNDRREKLHDWRKGNHWTDEELELMRWKKKAPVVFHKSISAIRTILGTFIQNKYDIKPAPFEPTDQDISDILTQRYHWNYHHTKCKFKDVELLQESIVGGDAWQESYIEITPGEKPRIIVTNQNPHAIYPDPNSRDLIERRDCNFIDRVSFMTLWDLIERFPEFEEELIECLGQYEKESQNSYEKDKRYAMRYHEDQIERNGQVKVVERFYRVKKKWWYGVNHNKGKRKEIGIDDLGMKRKWFRKKHPDYSLYTKNQEFLYLAIAVPAFSLNKLLMNEPYHNQPRDPVTGQIYFTLTQLFAEQLDGDVNGFQEYMIGPNKVINSMMSNKLHASKHATTTSLIYDPSKMDEDDVEDFEKHASDGDRRFKSKPGADPNSIASLVPQGRSAPDTNESLEWANQFHEEVSSAPPASRGVAEGNVPALLNQQRIEQAFIQLNTAVLHYKLFLTKRAQLWHYYDRTYFTAEETFRVMDKSRPQDPDFVTMNKWYRDKYGAVKKANDINAAAYDIVFEDSYQSATVRDKVRQQIVEMMQTNAVQQDPVLNTFLTLYMLKMTDAPQDLKDFVYEHSSVVKQWSEMQRQQDAHGQELDNAQKMQELAQSEAEQTAGMNLNQSGPGSPQAQFPQPQPQAAMAG